MVNKNIERSLIQFIRQPKEPCVASVYWNTDILLSHLATTLTRSLPLMLIGILQHELITKITKF